MSSEKPPRCGDIVRHRPTGQEWIVAWCQGEQLAPHGFPAITARLSDCEIVRRCTDEQHRARVQEWLRGNGPHRDRIREIYGLGR